MKRGAVQKRGSTLVNFYLPSPALPHIDRAARRLDSDRSKFIRLAIRERLARIGVATADEVWITP